MLRMHLHTCAAADNTAEEEKTIFADFLVSIVSPKLIALFNGARIGSLSLYMVVNNNK